MKEMTVDTPTPVPRYTLGEAWASVFRDPQRFVRDWNYKGAILSGGLRAPIFLITYLVGRESLKLAIGAALAQFAFRFVFAGVGGALIQSFRRVEPAWKALLTIMLIVPVISHILEYAVQSAFGYLTGTHDHTDEAIVRSICVSILSALFSLFIMRRDVMIVGEAGSKSLLSDMARMPSLVFEFMAFIPLEIARMLRGGRIITALAAFLGFGVFSQMLCWAVTNRPRWTYGGGREIFLLKFWGVDGLVLMLIAVTISLIVSGRTKKKS